MKYSIENNGSDTVLIRIYAPVSQASAFLSFIEQKTRESIPRIRSVSPADREDYLTKLKVAVSSTFDEFVAKGIDVKTAVSKTNTALKGSSFANITYDRTKNILSSMGRLKRKK